GVGKSARRFDADLLLLARCLVLRRHVQDAVGVDVEGHLDLRKSARCGRNARELELADGLVICSELTLTLKNVDLNGGLIVVGRREGLALLGRNRRVARDEYSGDSTKCLDTERQRRDVEEKNIL